MVTSYPRDAAKTLHTQLMSNRHTVLGEWTTHASREAARGWFDRTRPVPLARHIGRLLDVAFFASICEEEGRPIAFRLCYLDPSVAQEMGWPAVIFKTALPLEVEHMRKLSPAIDASSVDVCVFEQGGVLEIWGLLYLRAKHGPRAVAPGLNITSRQAGVLLVRETARDILIFSRGHASFFSNPLASGDVRRTLAATFDASRSDSDRRGAADRILGMAWFALDEGHGATIFVVPSGYEPRGLDAPRYSLHQSDWLMQDMSAISVAQAIARMAFMDGAMLLDEFGVFLGAGAMIRTEEVSDIVVALFDPSAPSNSPTRIRLREFSGGARHHSAMVFCYKNPGVCGLVVSHDGVLSMMIRHPTEDYVSVWRPFRRGSELALEDDKWLG